MSTTAKEVRETKKLKFKVSFISRKLTIEAGTNKQSKTDNQKNCEEGIKFKILVL